MMKRTSVVVAIVFALLGCAAHGQTVVVGNGGGDVATNVAVGDPAVLAENTGGHQTVAIGYGVLTRQVGETVHANTAGGYMSQWGTTTGSSNTTWGYQTLLLNGTGVNNTAVGTAAAAFAVDRVSNAIFGYHSFLTGGGDHNSTLGSHVLLKAEDASFNVGAGSQTLRELVGGNRNTAIGEQSLGRLLFGNSNTAVGSASCYGAQYGDRNICVGWNAGSEMGDGGGNVIIGGNTGATIAGRSNQILIADGDGTVRQAFDQGALYLPSLAAPAGQTYFVCIDDTGRVFSQAAACQ